MTLALRRFRLDGIGPAGARFDPLAVDLTVDETAARAAVLFLENGGGKSVLLRLLFSVVLPGRRYTVGSVKLDGYVGSGDTAHVVLEWETAQRQLVTGTLLEWRNRTRSGSSSNLLQFWYSFVPRAGVLTLDELPTRDGDRRVTRAGFRERLTALSKEHPELELVIEDAPGKWAEHLLRTTPLDPEIFRYQRQMNADEADAESLFAGLKTDEDFVRFVVEAVHDPEQLDGFDGLLSEYATHLSRHDQLMVEGRFCEEAAALLRPFAHAAAAVAETRAQASTARRDSEHLCAALLAGAEAADADAEHWAREASTATARVEMLRSETHRLADTASELRRLEAEFLHAEANKRASRARDVADDARCTASGWESVGVVVDLRRHQAEVDNLRAAQEATERELEPLRRAMGDAAGRYVGRLRTEAEALTWEADTAGGSAKEAESEAEDLAGRSAGAQREAGAAAATAAGLRRRIDEVNTATAVAREESLLRALESPAQGHQRVTTEREEVRSRLEAMRRQRRDKDAELSSLLDSLTTALGTRSTLESQLGTIRGELDHHVDNANALVAEPRVQEIAPDTTDIWVVADRLDQVLESSVRAAESQERALREEIENVDARLEQLGIDGLLPAAPDVVAVWDAIVASGIPAATGWSWLATNCREDKERRAQILTTNPALAGGVIVTDPTRVADACDAVRAAGIETETVVLVGTDEDLDRPGAGCAAPVRPALYDPDWTERTRRALEQERQGHVEGQERALAVLAVDAPLLSRLREHRERCPTHRRDSLRAQIQGLDQRLQAANDDVREVEKQRDLLREDLKRLTREEPELTNRLDRLNIACNRLAALVEQHHHAEQWARDADAADEQSQEHRRTATGLARDAGEQRHVAELARRRAAQARVEAAMRDETALKVGADPQEAPADVSTEGLAGAYEAARRTYEAEREGHDLTPAIEDAERRREQCADRLATLDPEIHQRAVELAASPGAEDASFRRARLAAARQDAEATAEAVKRCQVELGAASQLLSERSPRDRPRFIVLDPALEPADATQANQAAAKQQALFVARTQESREADAAARTAKEREAAATTRAKLLRSTVEILPAPLHGTPDDEEPHDHGAADPVVAWHLSTDEAQDAARALRQQFDLAQRTLHEQERTLAGAFADVRRVANDPTLAGVGGIRLALANEGADDLARRAALLADELDDMRRSIDAELAETQRHREGIVQRLATLVEGQLRQLKQLARLSTLPPGLGEWSGKPFVSVDFDQVAGAEITARLGPIVDAAAADRRKRNGIDLLLAGMRAAVVHHKGEVERTYTVRLLRPNRMMALQRASIAELENEFSGGMKLTAAICTYCALAALRANNRSTGSLFGLEPGPLFLDNPLGKASADYLLDLQHALAEKLRVQLVHTTGVWEVEALATYQRVVRLRNLADLRHNVRRLRVDDEVHLPGTGATIDAVGFSVRRGSSA